MRGFVVNPDEANDIFPKIIFNGEEPRLVLHGDPLTLEDGELLVEAREDLHEDDLPLYIHATSTQGALVAVLTDLPPGDIIIV